MTTKNQAQIEGKITAKVLKVLQKLNKKDTIVIEEARRNKELSIIYCLEFKGVSSFSSYGIEKILSICKEYNITLARFHHFAKDTLILDFYIEENIYKNNFALTIF